MGRISQMFLDQLAEITPDYQKILIQMVIDDKKEEATAINARGEQEQIAFLVSLQVGGKNRSGHELLDEVRRRAQPMEKD